jgi:hypothetical protein
MRGVKRRATEEADDEPQDQERPEAPAPSHDPLSAVQAQRRLRADAAPLVVRCQRSIDLRAQTEVPSARRSDTPIPFR